MRKLILGTAGHIDHGKTTLVRALTGVDTDRLAEEKRRGITIDLGFAQFELEDGTRFGIVDVPGHEAFIRNMLAGATGIDVVLLVIAADEGVMPQTREHLAIVELLGVRAAVVALTKSDLVDPEWLELVVDDVRDGLAQTPFASAPIVPVSAQTGEGIEELRRALTDAASEVGERIAEDLTRLPIDRVFTIKGTGTVVTGTLWSGILPQDCTVRILPTGRTARVRGVQVHGAKVDAAVAGQRVAAAVAGIDRDDLGRGDVLVTDEAWTASRMPTVRIGVLADSTWEIRSRQRVRFHLGTAEVMGRVVLLDRPKLSPGERGWAQIRLEAPIVARAGDRFVVRSYSPVTTIGGGIVAEPAPPKRKRLASDEAVRLASTLNGNADEAVEARVVRAGWAGVDESKLPIETPFPPTVIQEAIRRMESSRRLFRAGVRLYTAERATHARAAVIAAVDAFHREHALRPGIDRAELRRSIPGEAPPEFGDTILEVLLAEGRVEARGGVVARPGYRAELTADQIGVRSRVLAAISGAGLAPPSISELPSDVRERDDFVPILRLLEDEGEIVALTAELFAARSAVDEAAHAVRRSLGGRGGLGPADFKDVLPISRKFLIPLLEHFDRCGVTVRRGDMRAVPAS